MKTALRLRLLLIAAPVAHGCSGPSSASTATTPSTTVSVPAASVAPAKSTEVPYIPLRPAASASARPAVSPSFRSPGGAFCVGAERTEVNATMNESGESDFDCGFRPDAEASEECCGKVPEGTANVFIFSRQDTEQIRGEHRGACCYLVLQAIRGRPLRVENHERQASLVRGLAAWGG